jgi:hypothetical protein
VRAALVGRSSHKCLRAAQPLHPRMESQALHLHPIIVLLVVIGGGQLTGPAGVIFAVPALTACAFSLTSFGPASGPGRTVAARKARASLADLMPRLRGGLRKRGGFA